MKTPSLGAAALSFASFFGSLVAAQNPTVDLGYERYVGSFNSQTGINSFRGIRYAAPPTGQNRFRAPQAPASTYRTVDATRDAPACLQAPAGGFNIPLNNFTSEDCLFLNLDVPQNASGLPVMVAIHGGGYGLGFAGEYNYNALLTTQGNEPFIGISIQYRLGAFGFLSSQDVRDQGVLNAGLLDQQFALRWVQRYIHLFGGDRNKVTLYGQSAGAGSIMLHAMAYNGTQGTSLFRYGILSSPFIPRQYRYNDDFPIYSYNKFVQLAGCAGVSGNKLACLRNTPVNVLSAANMNTSFAAVFGTGSFSPVTDGTLVQYAPTTQLLQNLPLNGERVWVGVTAEEGAIVLPQNVTTTTELRSFIHRYFPRFTSSDVNAVLATYPQSAYGQNVNNPRFATTGANGGPTALDVSPVSIGPQQLANLIYGEAIFYCPSYWVATGFSRSSRTAYKYQYSVPAALHTLDIPAYLGTPLPNQGSDFTFAWRRMFGRFISTGVPNVSNLIGNGISTGNTAPNVLSNWQPWLPGQPRYNPQVNFNQTGGTPYISQVAQFPNVRQNQQPGLRNNFTRVDAISWEANRGARCEFWRNRAASVPY